MTSPPSELHDAQTLGHQRPRISSAPAALSSAGEEAVALASSAGLILDPWQRFVLDVMLRERPDGRWAAWEVALVVARQNGKGAILAARELAGLFLFGDMLILHSAHLFKTAQEAFRRIDALIQRTPDLKRRIKKTNYGNGEEGIELRSGARLEFVARSGKSGRGLTGDVNVIDEAMDVPEHAVSALMPTMATAMNPQVIYAASAVDQQNPAHANGLTLARLRRRGLAGDTESLAYLEWSVDEDRYINDPQRVAADPDARAQANPGLGIRITAEQIDREMRSMSARSFAVERLSVGDWPTDDEAPEVVIDVAAWRALADPVALRPAGPVAFGLAVSRDRKWASIGAASRLPDGKLHVELVDNRRGLGWVVDRVVELLAGRNFRVAVNPSSPAGAFLSMLRERGITPLTATSPEIAQASARLYDAVTGDPPALRHLGQPALDTAVGAVRRRKVGTAGAWTWDEESSPVDIAPLVAVTLAEHGLTAPGPRTPAPLPKLAPLIHRSETADLATAGF